MDNIADHIKFEKINISPRFKRSFIFSEEDIAYVESDFSAEIYGYDLIIIATAIPYENNFFFVGKEKIFIISFSDWHHLTPLPISNGIIFIICEILVRYVMRIGNSHQDNTGCICDFLWDKSGIDICMRAAFICDDCKRTSKSNPYIRSSEFSDLNKILNALSDASRRGIDLLSDVNSFKANRGKVSSKNVFDVFVCHNSRDKPEIRRLNSELKNRGVKTWFDEEQFEPGDLWQTKLERTIESINACVVVVGDSGFGPWQSAEQRAFIDQFLSRGCTVIPIIIGNSENIPELPLFLRQFMWSDLRDGDSTKIDRIVKVLKKF